MTIKNTHTKSPCGINIITLIMLIASLVNSSALHAKAGDTFTQGQLTYTIIDDVARLVSVKEASKSTGGSIVIPERVTNSNVTYVVKWVASGAFVGLQHLESVKFQKNIEISTGCFAHCPILGSVIFHDDESINIGRGSFQNCPSLPHIKLPNIATISDNLFGGSGLREVLIPSSVGLISTLAFLKCTDLKYVLIPNSVTNIKERAFWECTNLEHVTLPSSLTALGNRAFNSCSELTVPNINANNIAKVSHLPFYRLFQMIVSCNLQINNSLTFCKRKLMLYINSLLQHLMVTKQVGLLQAHQQSVYLPSNSPWYQPH